MAESKKPGFKRVTRNFQRSVTARRAPAEVTLAPSGYATTNVAATEMIGATLAGTGELPQQINFAFDVNEASGLVGISLAQPGEPGAVPAMLSPDKRRYSLHLGGVFQEYPQLAATFIRKCPFKQDSDGQLVIALSAAVAARKGPEDQATKAAKAAKRAGQME